MRKSSKKVGTLFMLVALVMVVYGMGILPFSIAFTEGEFRFSDKTLGALESISGVDDKANFYLVPQHVKTGDEWTSGGSSPYIPAFDYREATGFEPQYYAYSSPYRVPYDCTGTPATWWAYEPVRQAESIQDSKLHHVFTDVAQLPDVVDWRIDENANSQLMEFEDVISDYTTYPEYDPAKWDDYAVGSLVFGVFKDEIPIIEGNDIYVSFIRPWETPHPLYPESRLPLCGAIIGGNTFKDAWIMDQWTHFKFTPEDIQEPGELEPNEPIPGSGIIQWPFIIGGFGVGIFGIYLRRRR
jgi:hypothetical protein